MSIAEAKAEIARQRQYEIEGEKAARAGLHRQDCPYEKDTMAWHHWVYGCENEHGKQK